MGCFTHAFDVQLFHPVALSSFRESSGDLSRILCTWSAEKGAHETVQETAQRPGLEVVHITSIHISICISQTELRGAV